MFKHFGESEAEDLLEKLYEFYLVKKLESDDEFKNTIQKIHDMVNINGLPKVTLTENELESLKLFLRNFKGDFDLYNKYDDSFIQNLVIAYNANLLEVENISKEDLIFNNNSFSSSLCIEDDINVDMVSELISKTINNDVYYFDTSDICNAYMEKDEELMSYYSSFVDTNNVIETFFDKDEDCEIDGVYYFGLAIPIDNYNGGTIAETLVDYRGGLWDFDYQESLISDDGNYIIITFNTFDFIYDDNFWTQLKYLKKPKNKDSKGNVA